ncbi:MAG: 2OG-Fe(II) oxygenase [Magnetococcales bacterium]|nr:2OG-Fe(II) oxygenase [Magnetococcales bacterium]
MVVYLNPDWLSSNGGELVLYTGAQETNPINVIPAFGTVVLFLSEGFVHEVLPANRHRFSIAGWFRA